MPFFKACHGAGVRASPRRRFEAAPSSEEKSAVSIAQQTCRIRVTLRGATAKTISMTVPQGQRWAEMERNLYSEIGRNTAWQRVLFSDVQGLAKLDQRKMTLVYYRCETRNDASSCLNYRLGVKDKDALMWFIDSLETPQLLIEAREAGLSRAIVADKHFYRTYRYTEPRTHFFVAYEGFGKFSDSLVSYQYDQTGIEKKVSTIHPQLDETDEDLLVVLDFCRYSARIDLAQDQRIQILSRLLRRLLESMENTKQIPAGVIEIRKCKAKGRKATDQLTLEIWGNQLWPVAVCVVSSDAPIEGEELLLTTAYEWSTEYFGKHRHFLGARRVPYYGLVLQGSYLQFVGLQFVPKRELGLYRFSDLLCLIHQTDDLLQRERQLLMSFQSLLMSCADLARFHDSQPPLEDQSAVDEALNSSQHPCHTKFKVGGQTYDLVYGNASECTDHISNHAGSMTQIFAATSPQLPGRELVVKFCSRYGEDAHFFLSRRGWAPRLYAVQDIPGRQKMVVMERSPGQPLSVLVYNFMEKHPTATIEMVQEAFGPYLKQMKEVILRLHKRGLVHGDVRSPNLIVDDSGAHLIQLRPVARAPTNNWATNKPVLSPRSESTRQSTSSSSMEDSAFGARVHLIDFDWAGPVGKAMYPTLLNRRTNFPRDAQRAGYIKTCHDIEMLENICQMPYALWQSRKAEQRKRMGLVKPPSPRRV